MLDKVDKMSPSGRCPKPDCPNRGMLTVDANFIFYLVEGAIRYAQTSYPDLTNADRLPHILEELDGYLGIIKRCCSLDGTLYISDLVFDEVSLNNRREIDRKGLVELKKYSNAERRQIFQALRNHFPQPRIVSEQKIQALRGLFPNPEICPHDRDASLMVVVCDLAACGQPTIVLTSDPDFVAPIRWLVRQGVATLGGGHTFPTSQIQNRHYFHFLLSLHDCCNLDTNKYNPLAEVYFNAQIQRSEQLRSGSVFRRIMNELQEIWKIHSASLQHKNTAANLARGYLHT